MAAAGVPTGAVMAMVGFDGNTRAQIRPFLRAAPLECAAPFERRVIHFGTGFNRTARVGLRSAAVGYFDDYLRTPSRRHAVYASASHHEPRFLRASAAQAESKVCKLRHMCSSTDVDNTCKEPMPEATSRWAKFLALLIKLKGNIGLLLLLGISLWIGFLAVKKDPNQIATNIVDVCDKGHKIYNITSKGFLIIAEMLKGDSK